jgi:hypothetical protein
MAASKKKAKPVKRRKGSRVRDLRATKDNVVRGGVTRSRTIT